MWILNIIFAIVFLVIGYSICALMTASKVSDLYAEINRLVDKIEEMRIRDD